MKSEIITIGDELLIGQVVNTNQAFIAEQLTGVGIGITRMITVGDNQAAILDAMGEAWRTADIVIVTGGLGPTHDDITKKAVCKFFDSDLVSNDEVRSHIESLLAGRSLVWTQASEEQTMVPKKAKVFPNPLGTAPGMLIEEANRYFIVLPGVPYEMKAIVEQSVVPFLKSKALGTVVRHRTLRTTGIPESLLAQKLGNIEEILQGASLAFLPSPFGVRLRISVEAKDESSADSIIAGVEERIRARASRHIYGVGDEELEDVIGRLLRERKLRIAVAESCTGGLIADRITNVSGSSVYFDRGIVCYSNASKIGLLGVPTEMIRDHGAVSKEVATAMAAGLRSTAGTDIGLATTGIAGPTGATRDKPVGLVWIGYSDTDDTFALKYNFGTERLLVKQRASQAALELVRRRVLRLEES
jgi:nicotinamide-nucleotide amidase